MGKEKGKKEDKEDKAKKVTPKAAETKRKISAADKRKLQRQARNAAAMDHANLYPRGGRFCFLSN